MGDGAIYIDSDALQAPFRIPVSLRVIATKDPVWVNVANNGAEDGSQANPYNTVAEGELNVSNAGTVWIVPGNYPETFTTNKAMTLKSDNGLVKIGVP